LRLKGVQSVLIGSVAMMGSYENPETSLQVNARTVQVETGEVTKGEAFNIQGKFSQLFDLQTLLAQEFVTALGVKPTSEEEQRMQERETESLAAYRLYILGMQYLDEGKYSEAKAAFWEAAKPANFPAALLAWEKASEQEIIERERTGARDEDLRSALDASARKLASQGAASIYVLGMASEFNGRYDEAIDAYQTFLKFTQNKVLRWKYQTKSPIMIGEGNPGPLQYPPVVSDGVVYIGDNEALYALSSTTGRLLWKVAIPISQPVVADGTLYVSDRGKGILYALNAKSGYKLWQSELGVKLGRNVIVAGDMVYVCWSNNNPMEKPDARNILYALSRADGTLLWKYDIGARVGYSSPITVSEGIVYLLSTAPPTWDKDSNSLNPADFCTLSALDGRSGKLLWESEVQVAYSRESDNSAQIDYAPVVSSGMVYVVGLDGYLYALSGKSGQVQWRSEIKYFTGSLLELAIEGLRETGRRYSEMVKEMVKFSTGFLPIVASQVVYVPCDINLVPCLYMFDAQSGELRGQLDIGKKGEQWRGIDYSIIVADGVIYVRSSGGGDKAKTLYAFDLESKAPLWQYYVAGGISSPHTDQLKAE
jgi:outer membrane protein assembly factor BamB